MGRLTDWRWLLRPLDRRTIERVDDDLRDEFAFHLDQLAAEYERDGRSADDARRAAAARFGDVETYRRRCARIQLEDRIMLQRVNLALMIVVLVAISALFLHVASNQRAQRQALDAIASRLETLGRAPDLAATAHLRTELDEERRRSAALTAFLETMLSEADPQAMMRNQVRLVEVLEQAAATAETIDAPGSDAVRARILETIDNVRREMQSAEPAAIDPRGSGAQPVVNRSNAGA
ncbi:MAG: hypothetical protein KDA25_02910 [Phycisphaerales bacterium]|nr:hypothetical protein [Phycisphaerales bacterium]